MFSLIVLSLAILVDCFDGFSCTTGTSNVALGKTASQSSNYDDSKWLAPKGVDGNRDTSMHNGMCFHTNEEYQPWWRVDLKQDFYITSVVIYNRLDCCVDRARNIRLTIGKNLDSMNQAGYLDGNLITHTFTVDPPSLGRYVQLQLIGITENFHLCEVEVMAYPADVTNVVLGKSLSLTTMYRDTKLFVLDLGQNHNIVSFTMYNSLDCLTTRARNVTLTTGPTLDLMRESGYLNGEFNSTHTFVINPTVTARYMQLRLTGVTEDFNMCGIQVLGSPSTV